MREPPRVIDEGGTPGFERARSAPLVINESDAYAVDEAVRIRKVHGGRVHAVTIGSLATQDILYTAIAKGADEALRIDAEPGDPVLVAELLAAVARRDDYGLILTGVESYEDLASAVGPALAARLDRPFANAVSEIEVIPGDEDVVVTNELGGGLFQKLHMPLPAILCVQSGICRLSYPPTVRVLQARRRPPRSLTPAALGINLPSPRAEVVGVSPPRNEREPEILEGSPGDIADALLDRIQGVLSAS